MGGVLARLGIHKGWTPSSSYLHDEKITINQVLFIQQFGVSVEGTTDATNVLVKKAQIIVKKIARLDAFVNK